MGHFSIGTSFKDLAEAKVMARELWVEAKSWHKKQVTVADSKGERVWGYVIDKEYSNESGEWKQLV